MYVFCQEKKKEKKAHFFAETSNESETAIKKKRKRERERYALYPDAKQNNNKKEIEGKKCKNTYRFRLQPLPSEHAYANNHLLLSGI